ncbi:MAG: hypothetical protein ACKO9B_03960, partial [Planctomycetota bacterium]
MTSRPLPPDRAPIARPGVLPWLAAMAMIGTVAAGLAGAAERKPAPRPAVVPPSRLPPAVTDAPRGTVLDVAPVDRARRAAVAEAAARIDELVAAGWQARG